MVSSSDSTLYIVYTSTDAGDSFKGAWEKVPSKKQDYMFMVLHESFILVVCCPTVTLSSTLADFTGSYSSFFMGKVST